MPCMLVCVQDMCGAWSPDMAAVGSSETHAAPCAARQRDVKVSANQCGGGCVRIGTVCSLHNALHNVVHVVNDEPV